ncbi:MAG: ATP synthase subunit I [Bacteroides sp.]|nr:ATP synthase subunit I [Eubacterium sp.]MCM1419092.1 ATP synthase subunit I [Roseburia sp.]MCM1462954.1 ATP synthase subunit I [Bacteroides sp.]
MKNKENPALAELKEMLPTVLTADGLILLTILSVGLAFGADWRLYTGLLVGNILFAANFILLGRTALSIARTRDARRGRVLGNASYGARYIGMFVILAILLSLKLISPFTAVIPLFYPKIHYTIRALGRRYDDEER